jgi:hypothetical protein
LRFKGARGDLGYAGQVDFTLGSLHKNHVIY